MTKYSAAVACVVAICMTVFLICLGAMLRADAHDDNQMKVVCIKAGGSVSYDDNQNPVCNKK